MYYSITFTDPDDSTIAYNTWDDWHMVPSSRPYVAIPAVKTDYIDIPGANGSLDYTEALDGVLVENSTGTWDFIVLNTQDTAIESTLSEYNWAEVYHALITALHGKKFNIVLESDPDVTYTGRVFVSWETQSNRSTVSIEYNIDMNDGVPDNPYRIWYSLDTLTVDESVDGQLVTLYVLGDEPLYVRSTVNKGTWYTIYPKGYTVSCNGMTNSAAQITEQTFTDSGYTPLFFFQQDGKITIQCCTLSGIVPSIIPSVVYQQNVNITATYPTVHLKYNTAGETLHKYGTSRTWYKTNIGLATGGTYCSVSGNYRWIQRFLVGLTSESTYINGNGGYVTSWTYLLDDDDGTLYYFGQHTTYSEQGYTPTDCPFYASGVDHNETLSGWELFYKVVQVGKMGGLW